MKKLFILEMIGLVTFIMACSHKLYIPMEQDATYAKSRWSNTDLAKLQRGKAYYEGKCGKCHGLKNPAHYSEEDWNHIMPEMAKKAKIADTTSEVIIQYVLTAAHGIKEQKKSK